jgi:hypothetical protein
MVEARSNQHAPESGGTGQEFENKCRLTASVSRMMARRRQGGLGRSPVMRPEVEMREVEMRGVRWWRWRDEGRRMGMMGVVWIGAAMQKQLLQLKRRFMKLWTWPMSQSLKIKAGLEKRGSCNRELVENRKRSGG